MPNLRIMTFNVENMLDRFNFREWEKQRLATLPDIQDQADRANLIRTYWNALNDENRVFTALTMSEKAPGLQAPDVVCLQEVETLGTLRAFRDRYLRRFTRYDYDYAMLIEGNDPRGIDVAVLSRFRIVSATTHQDLKGDVRVRDDNGEWVTRHQQRIFRRDCLEVHVKKQNKVLPIFVCHFKSMSGGRPDTRFIREAEAQAVRDILAAKFADPAKAAWVVVGDLNDYTETDGTPDTAHGLAPLLDGGFAVDIVKNIAPPEDRWTHYYAGEDSYHQLDYILLSPALAKKTRNKDLKPTIVRHGQPHRADRFQGMRWPRVGYDRPKASDHCPVVADVWF